MQLESIEIPPSADRWVFSGSRLSKEDGVSHEAF